MRVTYIDHSSFLVELDTHYLLFDYFQGEIPKMDGKKDILVFASHRHDDHFSPLIFELAAQYPHVRYVISDDIWQNRVPEELYGNAVFIGPEEREEVEGAVIETYRSTDEGVAFLVEIEGKTIYHAGDLNYWGWPGEAAVWNKQMETAYRGELDKISKKPVDVAFLPVDSRLQENFYLGADDFMSRVGAKIVFPMHFWGDYSVGARLKALPCAKDYRDKVVEIHKKGEEFCVD